MLDQLGGQLKRGFGLVWRNPTTWAVPVLAAVALSILAVGFMGAAFMVGRGPGGGSVAFFGLLVVAAAPAITSGLFGTFAAAATTGRGTFQDFWRHLFTYYWRIVGGALLLFAAFLVLTLVFAGGMMGTFFGQGMMGAFQGPMGLASPGGPGVFNPLAMISFLGGAGLLLALIALAIVVVIAAWPAAVSVENQDVFKALETSFQFAKKNVGPLVVLYVIYAVAAGVLRGALGRGALALLLVVASVFLQAWLRMTVFASSCMRIGARRLRPRLPSARPGRQPSHQQRGGQSSVGEPQAAARHR